MSIIVLHERDNVGVAKESLAAGDRLLADIDVSAERDIPAMHKVAIRDIPEGGKIRKFSQVIGYAMAPISAGEHVHSHNCLPS